MNIYSTIKKIRESKGYTQEYVAEKLGIATNNYRLLEKGKINLSIERLKQLSDIFEVKIADFLILDENDFVNESFAPILKRIESQVALILSESTEKIKLLNDKVNFLHNTTVGIEEIRDLALDIEDQAKKGSGLTKLEYDLIKKKFITEYKELKK